MMTDAEVQADNARAHLLYVLFALYNACEKHVGQMPTEVLLRMQGVHASRSAYGEQLQRVAAGRVAS